jgi:uncharacterized protein
MAEHPFLDLFHDLRQAGMPLAPEQYDLLRQALDQGYGLKGWEDLRRLCRLLWVKPCANYDSEVFERAFDRYVQQLRHQWQAELEPPAPLPTKRQKASDVPVLPSVPPRQMPAQQPAAEGQAPIAVKTAPPQYQTSPDPKFRLMPTQMPVQLETIRGSWKTLRQWVREGQEDELDLEETIARINRNGIFGEVVLRPCLVQRAELLILIDESEAMVPFHPAIQPLITAVEEHRISPAQLYRFTVFPDEFLYQWQHPTKAVPLVPLLSRLHRSRTIVWIVSDAGAAAGTYSLERLNGIVEFLTRLLPCVRELLWINPLPAERWQSTTAEAIAQALDGRMIALDPISLQRAAREPVSSPILKLWSLPRTENLMN